MDLEDAGDFPRPDEDAASVNTPHRPSSREGLQARLQANRRLRLAWQLAEATLLVAALAAFILVGRLFWAGVASVVLLIALRWLARQPLWRLAPTSWTIVLILLSAPVAAMVSPAPAAARQQIGYLLSGVLLYTVVLVGTTRLERLPHLLTGLMLALIGLACIGPLLIQTSNGPMPVPAFVVRLGSGFAERVNPNVISGALALWLPACVAIAWRPPAVGRSRKPLRFLAALAAISVLGVVLLLRSRGVWLAIPLGVILAAGLMRPRFLAVFPLVVAGLWLGMSNGWLARMTETMFRSDPLGGLAGRLEIWSSAVSALHDFPVTGSGFGAWTQVAALLYPYQLPELRAPEVSIPHAHNLFLQVGVDLGVLGLVAYAALVGLSLWMARSAQLRWRNQDRSDLSSLAFGVLAGQFILLFHGLFDAVTWGTKPAALAWVLFAMASVLYLAPQAFGVEGADLDVTTPVEEMAHPSTAAAPALLQTQGSV